MKRVAVYWNLHRQCWSIQSRQGPDYGRVIAHARDVLIYKAEFKVSEAGRQRVLRERKKNVHAFVVGGLSWYRDLDGVEHDLDQEGLSSLFLSPRGVTYNPYKGPTFVDSDGVTVERAHEVSLSYGRAVLAWD